MMNLSKTHSFRFGCWSVLLVVGTLASACSSKVDLKMGVITPCDKKDLLTTLGCQYFRVVVSSLDPEDPLHPSQAAYGLGPFKTTCRASAGTCGIDDKQLLGIDRLVDVLCLLTKDGIPLGRATSSPLNFDTDASGVTLNLEMGSVNGFVATTVTDPNAEVGSCSKMESGGRYGHAAALLQDGRVLITGGMRRGSGGQEEILATAEIFDPATGWHQTLLAADGTPLKMLAKTGRAFHTAVTLRNGKVLLAGGVGKIEDSLSELQSAELFDPETDNFMYQSKIDVGRAHHTATLLSTGEVLIAGGASYEGGVIAAYLDSGTIYDPVNNSWKSAGGRLSTGRAFHQAVLLDPKNAGGKVLILGGDNESGPTNTIDLFSPDKELFESGLTAVMKRSRSHHCAVRMKDGSVLVSGGINERDGVPDMGIEVYTPANGGVLGSFQSDIPGLNVGRMDHSCSLLDSGDVLIAGGAAGGGQATAVAELISGTAPPVVQSPLSEPLNPARTSHTATVLPNGWVYIAGGHSAANGAGIDQSVLFVPMPSFF